MKTNMKVTIIVDGIERNYEGDYDTMYNRDWDEEVRELLDKAKEYEVS